MITIKTASQMEKIEKGGKILAEILDEVITEVKPGVSTGYLDKKAEQLIFAKGGEPSFKGYSGGNEPAFPSTLCTSVNEQVVHAPASFDVIIKSGDILSLDIGMKYDGYFTDMAKSVGVGKVSKFSKKIIKTTKKCLDIAVKEVKPGKTIADIGKVIEQYAKSKGFSVVRDLVGHGVGFAVHEDPKIPNYYIKENERIILRKGMVLAIEPMLVEGDYRVVCESDGWTIRTLDRKLSAHFEHTVIVTEDGAKIATM